MNNQIMNTNNGIFDVMGEISYILLAAFVVIFIFLLYKEIKTMIAFSAEKKAYSVMVNNPSDATVIAYLAAYEKTNTKFAQLLNSQKGVQHRNNQLRQAQGFEIVNDCDAVSNDVKTKLKTAFISQGVPIIRRTTK